MLVFFRKFFEFCKVVFFYYRKFEFAKADFYLLRSYLTLNPFKISKSFLQKRGEKDLYQYGETPLTTFDMIARKCQINKTDVVYELGSGSGRLCFWLKYFIGCKVMGVDYVPDFIAISNKVKKRYSITDVDFVCQDILDVDFSKASVVYYYGTMADEAFIIKLIDKLKRLPKGSKVITVSYPLTNYVQEPFLKLEKTFKAKFTWGVADVYIQVIA